jgi:hypothetical protein
MFIAETEHGKFSASVETGMTNFVREDGRCGQRMHVKVTIWEHLDTARKYQHLLPASEGYSFCQPNDEFDLEAGARMATTRALDGLGFTNNVPAAQAIHKAVKTYVAHNPWL